MRVIKPNALSLEYRVLEVARRFELAITAMVIANFSERTIYPEEEIWRVAESQLGGERVDEGFAKPASEWLAFGDCYAQEEVGQTTATLSVGDSRKTVAVVGDRFWMDGVASAPRRFKRMPIGWPRAYGGPDYTDNPVGRGAASVDGAWPLPNVEDPRSLILTPQDRPEPAGFGPIDAARPQRASLLGTYGRKWEEDEFPGFASDLNLEYFCRARADQRVDAAFRGDEDLRAENMHPTKSVLEGALPRIRARIFVNQRTAAGEEGFFEAQSRLETLVLLPNVERVILVFRARVPVRHDDAFDVLQMLGALEDLGEPKDFATYGESYLRRMDRKARASLSDSDLVPEWLRASAGARRDDDVPKDERLVETNLRRRMQRHLEEIRATMVAEGLDPDASGVPRELPPMPPDEDDDAREQSMEVAEAEADAAVSRAQGMMAKAELDARAACEENGIDYDAKVAAGRVGGPPKVSADEILESLRDTAELNRNAGVPDAANLPLVRLSDPTLDRDLRRMEAKVLEAYRELAHYLPSASLRTGPDVERIRREVVERHRSGAGFARQDLTGADLSGLDLRGADFREALLERVVFVDAILEGANFEGAVLARADFERADVRAARFAASNLGGARLAGLDLSGLDLRRCVMLKANLSDANLSHAKLDGAVFTDGRLVAANFHGASLRRAELNGVALDGTTWSRADLSGALMMGLDLSGLDFTEANFFETEIIDCTATKTLFRNARMNNVRISRIKDASRFSGADFSGAILRDASLRNAVLEGADFTGANMQGADLSGAEAEAATFYRIVAKDSLWIRAVLRAANLTSANLMGAVLKNADSRGAVFRGANLFGANLIRMRVDGATDVSVLVFEAWRSFRLATDPEAKRLNDDLVASERAIDWADPLPSLARSTRILQATFERLSCLGAPPDPDGMPVNFRYRIAASALLRPHLPRLSLEQRVAVLKWLYGDDNVSVEGAPSSDDLDPLIDWACARCGLAAVWPRVSSELNCLGCGFSRPFGDEDLRLDVVTLPCTGCGAAVVIAAGELSATCAYCRATAVRVARTERAARAFGAPIGREAVAGGSLEAMRSGIAAVMVVAGDDEDKS